VGRLDAVIIFKKWCDEKSPIRCQGSFATHAFGLEGLIASTRVDEVVLVGSTLLTQIVVKLTDELTFNYADSREVTGEEAENYSSCLTVGFGPIPEVGPVDSIAFAQITPKRAY
jgi:hypothetical protein